MKKSAREREREINLIEIRLSARPTSIYSWQTLPIRGTHYWWQSYLRKEQKKEDQQQLKLSGSIMFNSNDGEFGTSILFPPKSLLKPEPEPKPQC